MNVVFLVKIAGMSGWFALLYLVPIANFILGVIVAFKLGARFGKGGVFSFFLLFLFPTSAIWSSASASPATARSDVAASLLHLVRHGEVHNPSRVLYGRLPDYHLSTAGRRWRRRRRSMWPGSAIR